MFWKVQEDLVISVAADNRIRLYETSGKIRQSFVENDHFSFRYTCVDWTRKVVWNDKHPNKVVPGPPKNCLGLLALGTDQGHVCIWDLSRGVIALRLGKGKNLKSMTGVVFTADGKKVYSSSLEDMHVLEWDLKTGDCTKRLNGDKHGASCLSLERTSGILAIARTRIHLLDGASGERLRKISSGHASFITTLSFSDDGRYLASCAQGSRYINIFDCQGSSKKEKPALLSLALDGCPTSVDLAAVEDGEKVTFSLLVCCDDGSCSFLRQEWENEHAGEASSGRVERLSSALAARFIGGNHAGGRINPTRALVVYGSEAAPCFEKFTFASGGGGLLASVNLVGISSEEKEEKGSSSKKRKRKEVEALHSENPASVKSATDVAGEEGSKRRKEESELTFGSRLEELVMKTVQQERQQRLEQESRKEAPKAGSLLTVLTQALKSSDEDLLEQCLAVQESRTISSTVGRLPSPLTLTLVETLVKKLERRPTRAGTIAPWMHALLLHHTSYLVSVPSLQERLAALHQLTSRRVAVLPRLLGLSGRLDLMLSQILKTGSYLEGAGEEKKPAEIYVDDDDDMDGSVPSDTDIEGGEDGVVEEEEDSESDEEDSD